MAAASICIEVEGVKFFPTPKGLRVGTKSARVQHPYAALADFPAKRRVRRLLSRSGFHRHAAASVRPE